MKAVKFNNGVVAVAEVDRTAATGVRVRIASAGICGSDIGFLQTNELSVIPGHELAGWTDDGVAVAIQPNVSCGSCAYCRAGQSQVCPSAYTQFTGVATDGGFADYVFVKPEQLHPLPDGFPVEFGALAEPTAVANHAVGLVRPEVDDTILVIGGGTIGLFAASIAAVYGSRVHLLARHRHQIVAAERLGISVSSESPEGLAPSSVVDAAGSQSSLELAIAQVNPRGTIVSVGAAPWKPRLDERLMYKEIMLRGSIIYTPSDFTSAISFLDHRRHHLDALVTHHFRLDEAPEAFAIAQSRAASAAIKVLMHP